MLGLLSEIHAQAGGDPLWEPHAFTYFDATRRSGQMEALAYDIRRSTGAAATLR